MPRKIELTVSEEFSTETLAHVLARNEYGDLIELLKEVDLAFGDWEFSREIWRLGKQLKADYDVETEDDEDAEEWTL